MQWLLHAAALERVIDVKQTLGSASSTLAPLPVAYILLIYLNSRSSGTTQ